MQSSQSSSSKLLGVGLYTVGEAAAYTGIKARDIHRWLFGYRAGGRFHQGLWQSELADLESKALGFHDLLEIRFVHAFREHGVSLQAIRAAAEHAREYFSHPYPFTCRSFQTDGRHVFATVLEETGDETILDLVNKQLVFKQIIKPSLYEGIDYRDDEAQRWYPLRRSKAVVLDPMRNFGKAILTDSGVDTAALAAAYEAEGQNLKRVASLYEVPVSEVELAIRFEHRERA
jgi:DNA-binding transcriptional MerR regulator